MYMGEIFKPGVPEKGNHMFCGQHSCRVTHDGYLYVFNNNDCNMPDYPSIVMMQQPVSEKDTLKKIWEYTCAPEEMNTESQLDKTYKPSVKTDMPSLRRAGGNVMELPDGSIFASLCFPYANVFIVNRDKKILWNAIAEEWHAGENKWMPKSQYRASIITDPKDLERLIWNQEHTSSMQ